MVLDLVRRGSTQKNGVIVDLLNEDHLALPFPEAPPSKIDGAGNNWWLAPAYARQEVLKEKKKHDEKGSL